jgi:hypothetical protein
MTTGWLGGTRFDGGGQFIAFHPGHGEIGDDEVEFIFFEDDQGFFGVIRGDHIVTVKGEHHLDCITNEWLIVDHENSFFWERHLVWPS